MILSKEQVILITLLGGIKAYFEEPTTDEMKKAQSQLSTVAAVIRQDIMDEDDPSALLNIYKDMLQSLNFPEVKIKDIQKALKSEITKLEKKV